MRKVLCMIPARAGSTRLREKNLCEVGRLALPARAVRTALAAGCFDEVWLNSRDERIQAMGREEGARVHVRPADLVTDETRTAEIVAEFMTAQPSEILVVMNPTSPLLRPDTVHAFTRCARNGVCDVLVSVTEERHHLFDARMRPLNFHPAADPRTQDTEVVYRAGSALMAWRPEFFLGPGGGTWGGRLGHFVLPANEAVDIHTQEDLDYARFLADRRGD